MNTQRVEVSFEHTARAMGVQRTPHKAQRALINTFRDPHVEGSSEYITRVVWV